MYHVFTGNGHHIYIPLEQGITKEEVINYKDSYRSRVSQLGDYIPSKCIDYQMFQYHKHGRLPYTVNSKSNSLVRFVGENNHPVCKTINDLLEFKHVQPNIFVTFFIR